MTQKFAIKNGLRSISSNLLIDITTIFKALSDPTRAQLINLLTQRECSVNELSEHVSVSASAVSHHLAKLRSIRLVRTRRESNQIFYSIDDSHIANLFREAFYHLDHIHQNLPDNPYSPHIHDVEQSFWEE